MIDLTYKLIKDPEEIPYDILLLADETLQAINNYVFQSEVYLVMKNNRPIAAFCLCHLNDQTIELMNIAVISDLQGQGIGSRIIDHIKRLCKHSYGRIIVGTPDCADRQIYFYEKNGFVKFDKREDFYLINYEQPIFENGVQLRDMILLKFEYEAFV